MSCVFSSVGRHFVFLEEVSVFLSVGSSISIGIILYICNLDRAYVEDLDLHIQCVDFP